MLPPLAGAMFVLTPMPTAHFGAGTASELPRAVRGTGSAAAVIVTDPALAGTPVVARVRDALATGGMATGMFAGARPNPSTDDVAAGADVVAELAAEAGPVAVVAVGGGSAIDAAKGIALAAVNP